MKSIHFTIAALAICLAPSLGITQSPTESDYYKITTFETPEGEVIEACGFQWMPDGRVAVCSRRGDIFMIANPLAEQVTADQFSLFARGLHEPLSLAEKDGWLYATQRPEITRMKDEDGDGSADVFETYADGWGISGDYHEYAFGSKFDADGNLAITLCLTGSFSSVVPFRGWAMQITPDGETIPLSSGVRSPGGMGANLAGDIFYTDNQGPWNGTCGLKVLGSGKFMGHPGGLKWYELAESAIGPQPLAPESGSRIPIQVDRIEQFVPPAILFPYDKMGKSASGIACDTSAGKFGPFAGQMFVSDQTQSRLMRVFLEKVNDTYQGACIPFLSGFASGNVGTEMTPSGAMFVGGTNRGWGSTGNKPFAVQRVDWTGKVPFEIHEMRLRPDGFELTFTHPVDEATASDASHFKMTTYAYEYREQYGSPEVDHTEPTIQSATVSPDKKSVRLVIDGLQRGHVHELHADGVRDQTGNPLLHAEAYYTVNQLRN
ncbi:hypothetical protein K227x_61590 [Rubripirellula lacrimiformis]|uniref:DUF7133 domain-containing protein n=1 Tax=Rubripirellula lacrimiformis TaxID=1930273 RepID=A0A517NKS8_9BACT|nr:hypothetical protein [Rubripirellula lacrimiformis]QDT07731.1 hypothetical protein K227x_61590 [Rubripirellula lacrimiformis]